MKRVFTVILLAAALFTVTGCSSGKMNDDSEARTEECGNYTVLEEYRLFI